jgi:hypothetical protein
MAYSSETKFLVDFSDLTPKDKVSGNPLTVVGSSGITLLENNLGYSMQTDQYLTDDVAFNISTALTVGFWLKPNNPGMVVDPSPGTVKSLNISVLDIVDVNDSVALRIYELTQADKTNRLRVDIIGNEDASIISKSYAVNTWHHFWFVWDGSAIDLFVDGVSESSSRTGTVPTSVAGSSGTVSINRLATTPGFNIANNDGDIDDIVILNTADSTAATIQKVINQSLDFAFNTSFMTNEEIEQAFLFDDPDVVRITSAHDDSTSIFASRSDGQIIEGSPIMWEARRTFKDDEEVNSLNVLGDGFQSLNGILEINGIATFRI